VAEFTFHELHARTTDLTGPERAAVFDRLPDELQTQAWARLRERFDHIAELDHRDWCRDGV
jgi:hypothetical protein